jgi:Rrf2 family protein
MKFSSQEEYGLRCLLQLASRGEGTSATIADISEAEGLSQAYVAKLLRLLRINGFVASVRGQEGGYTLASPARDILVSDVLATLGDRFYEPGFCEQYSGTEDVCTRTASCTIRPVWSRIQRAVDDVLRGISLEDLLREQRSHLRQVLSPDSLLPHALKGGPAV